MTDRSVLRSRVRIRYVPAISVMLGSLLLAQFGCKDLAPELPAGTQDPSTVYTADGALALYRGSLRKIGKLYGSFILETGQFTDELEDGAAIGNPGFAGLTMTGLDGRNIQEGYVRYDELHIARTQAALASAALERYAPASSAGLRKELTALQGFTVLMLTDWYCSGIPFGRIMLDGDYEYTRGLTTTEAYQYAVQLFDSVTMSGIDTSEILHLANMGKGRALLALGAFEQAAQAVANVPVEYRYTFPAENPQNIDSSFIGIFSALYDLSVSDMEGNNGLPFVSTRDPRVTVVSKGRKEYVTDPIWAPRKYDQPWGTLAWTLANGIEARLIEAEADLQTAGTRWIQILNALRTNGTWITQPNPDNPAVTDTLWQPGTGNVVGLPPLLDPGLAVLPSGKTAKDVRVDLLFRERAYWLFLTGHRQGDLRRLIRTYKREPEEVYPTGYYGGIHGELYRTTYGTDVTVAVPAREMQLNPYYKGCEHRDA